MVAPAVTPRAVRPAARAGLFRQAARFGIVGSCCAVIDYGSYIILYLVLGMWYVPAKAIGWTLGAISSYCFNRRWTFQAKGGRVQFLSVMTLNAVTFVVQVGLNTLLVPLVPATWFWTTAVFVVAQAAVTIINFAVQRMVIFRVR